MRIGLLTAGLLAMCLGVPGAEITGAQTSSPIKLTQVVKDGTLRITAKNVSKKPILAYVVAVDEGGQVTTHHDFYTGREVFGPGKTIELTFAVHSTSAKPQAFVDYVRLAGKSTWGSPVTDDGKDVAASFQN